MLLINSYTAQAVTHIQHLLVIAKQALCQQCRKAVSLWRRQVPAVGIGVHGRRRLHTADSI